MQQISTPFAKLISSGAVAIAVASLSGCDMMHNLQPHRLQRLNRSSPPSGDPYFSVIDPVARYDAERERQSTAETKADSHPRATANPVLTADE